MVVMIIARAKSGKSVEIDLCDTEEQFKSIRVRQLKEKILEKRDYLGLEARYGIIPLLDNKFLHDDTLLSDCGVQHMSVIGIYEPKISRGGRKVGGKGDKEGKNRSMENLMLM